MPPLAASNNDAFAMPPAAAQSIDAFAMPPAAAQSIDAFAMPPAAAAQNIDNQFAAMSLNQDSSAVSAEEEKAQSAIDDIFAEIKPVTATTTQAPASGNIDAAQLFDFGSADTLQGVNTQANIV